jgi:hypothetical protein
MPCFDEAAGFSCPGFVDKTVENVDNSLKNYYDSELCNSCLSRYEFGNLTCLAVFRNDFEDNHWPDFSYETLSRARP